jgi:hypothetical protein
MPPAPEPRTLNAPPFDAHSQNYFARSHSNKKLPDPAELATRLEEARTSAKLLSQVVTNTPPQEILANDLIKEFADRCQSASRSIQAYMIADSPPPDNDTMESLIDTNEQLQSALNQHQRAVLGARKQLGVGETLSPISPEQNQGQNGVDGLGFGRPQQWQTGKAGSSGSGSGGGAPPLPARIPLNNGKGKETEIFQPHRHSPAGGSSSSHNKDLPDEPIEDPFRDPQPEPQPSSSRPGGSNNLGLETNFSDPPRLSLEPFHPELNATPSYVGRQDSAVGNITMRGAAGADEERDKEQPGQKATLKPRYEDDDDDIYESTPKRKEPMYRY